MINPRTVTYVRTVAEEGSFSKAAGKLFISQPSLSANILRAEKEYDVSFFNRNTSPVSLTYAGEIFLKEADKIEQMDEQLTRKLLDINHNMTGRIIVGESPAMMERLIPGLFQSFHQKYPDVELHLKEGTSIELVDDVRHGKADLAFTSCNEPVRDLIFMPVIQREIFLIHAGKEKKSVTTISMKELKEEPFILLSEGRELRKHADTLFQEEHVPPRIAYETTSYELSLRLAEAGLGWAFMVDSGDSGPGKGMQCYRLDGRNEIYQINLVYRKDSYFSRPMKYFMELAEKIGSND